MDSNKRKDSKKYSILSLILGILSCFYTATFVCSMVLIKLAYVIQPNSQAMHYETFHYFALILILIASVLSLFFAHISIKRGVKIKITKVGRILSVISIIIAVIAALIAILFLF